MNLSIMFAFLGLLAVQTTNAGTVRGSVLVAGTQAPLSGVRVLLVPASASHAGYFPVVSNVIVEVRPRESTQNIRLNPLRRFRAFADDAGRFSLTGVVPGSYTLFAWDNEPTMNWTDPSVFAGYAARGLAVTVAPGLTVQATPQSIPKPD